MISLPQEHSQTPSHTHPKRCWEARPLDYCNALLSGIPRKGQKSRNYNIFKTVPLGSFWEYANMNTSHPSFTHCVGFQSLPRSNTKSPSSHGVSRATLPCTLKNSHPPSPKHAHSAPPTATDFFLQGPSLALSETEPSVPLLHNCGTPSQNVWGIHRG